MAYSQHTKTLVEDVANMTPEAPVMVYLQELLNFRRKRGFNPDISICAGRVLDEALCGLVLMETKTDTTKLLQNLALQAIKSPMPTTQFSQDLIEISLELPDITYNTTPWRILKRDIATGFQRSHSDSSLYTRSSGPLDTALSKVKPRKLCGSCGKVVKALHDGSKAGVGDVELTAYCSIECKENDWQTHNTELRRLMDGKRMHRAASMIQSLYYMWRGHCFDHDIVKFEEKHGILYLYDGDRKKEASFPMWDFPDMGHVSAEDKAALLTVQNCYRFMGHLSDLVKFFIEDLCSDIRELGIRVENVPRPTTWVEPNGRPHNNMFNRHSVFRANLKSGDSYCLDITGAQFGFRGPVTKWDTFSQENLLFLREDRPFGSTKADVTHVARSHHPDCGAAQMYEELSALLMVSIEEWAAGEQDSISAMLDLPEDTFNSKTARMLTVVEEKFVRRLSVLKEERRYMAG